VPAPAFQLQARLAALTFDLFLETADGDEWIFRRHPAIARPIDALRWSSGSTPVIRPEVQLLYMAKSTEPKNEQDFRLVAPTLDEPARAWLRQALEIAHPGHRWTEALR
jgi:hypothetical protein